MKIGLVVENAKKDELSIVYNLLYMSFKLVTAQHRAEYEHVIMTEKSNVVLYFSASRAMHETENFMSESVKMQFDEFVSNSLVLYDQLQTTVESNGSTLDALLSAFLVALLSRLAQLRRELAEEEQSNDNGQSSEKSKLRKYLATSVSFFLKEILTLHTKKLLQKTKKLSYRQLVHEKYPEFWLGNKKPFLGAMKYVLNPLIINAICEQSIIIKRPVWAYFFSQKFE